MYHRPFSLTNMTYLQNYSLDLCVGVVNICVILLL